MHGPIVSSEGVTGVRHISIYPTHYKASVVDEIELRNIVAITEDFLIASDFSASDEMLSLPSHLDVSHISLCFFPLYTFLSSESGVTVGLSQSQAFCSSEKKKKRSAEEYS